MPTVEDLLKLLSDVYDSYGVWVVASPGKGDAHDVLVLEVMRAVLDEHLPDEGREPCPSKMIRRAIGMNIIRGS